MLIRSLALANATRRSCRSRADFFLASSALGEVIADFRSEERRVGKECDRTSRPRWVPQHDIY